MLGDEDLVLTTAARAEQNTEFVSATTRFATNDAAKGWEELCRQAPHNLRRAWEAPVWIGWGCQSRFPGTGHLSVSG